jgi:predicted NAD-dependent protein-ADP-ribosyltransferase YbiA (DUF1768 family)
MINKDIFKILTLSFFLAAACDESTTTTPSTTSPTTSNPQRPRKNLALRLKDASPANILSELKEGLKNKEDFSQSDDDGKTPLHYFLSNPTMPDPDTAEQIIKRSSAVLNKKDKSNNHALDILIANANLKENVELLDILAKNGMNLDTPLKDKSTIVHKFFESSKLNTSKDLEMATLLISKYPKIISKQNDDKKTPLDILAQDKAKEKALLDALKANSNKDTKSKLVFDALSGVINKKDADNKALRELEKEAKKEQERIEEERKKEEARLKSEQGQKSDENKRKLEEKARREADEAKKKADEEARRKAEAKSDAELRKKAQEIIKPSSNIRLLLPGPAVWKPTEKSLKEFAKNDPDKEKVIEMVEEYKNKANIFLPFYHDKKNGGAFANTFAAKTEIEYRGQKSLYVEVLWQAEKLSRYAKEEKYRNYPAAVAHLNAIAKKDGPGNLPIYVRSNISFSKTDIEEWDKMSVDLMSKVHAARFKVEPDLFLNLMSTDYGTIIVENTQDSTKQDPRWGNGKDGKGQNLLGLLYMTHREHFWKEFKKGFEKDKKTNFHHTNVDHVVYMLKWLEKDDR